MAAQLWFYLQQIKPKLQLLPHPLVVMLAPASTNVMPAPAAPTPANVQGMPNGLPRDGSALEPGQGTITSAKLFANAQLPVTVCNTSQCGAKRRCLDEEVEEEVEKVNEEVESRMRGKTFSLFSFFSFLFLTPYLICALHQLS